MNRLTSRNDDGSITTSTISGKQLLERLAECEDQLERIEKSLVFLIKQRDIAHYKQEINRYRDTRAFYNGKYSGLQKSVEAIKRAMEGKSYGK